MTDQVGTQVDLLHQRLALVANLSALNAEALKLTQALAGMEMDIQRFELEIAKNGATEKLAQDLHDADKSAETIRARQSECSENIAAVESAVAEVDQLLAAADAKQRENDHESAEFAQSDTI
jgi:predicted  nucleic acid-binding Zn-ribbon protein